MDSLKNYRLLGRSGLRVSPLSLGTMTFGKATSAGAASWGADRDESRRMFDTYADRGGNFIDTANGYARGESESFLGGFLEGRRDRFVLGTKYSFGQSDSDPNLGGNHRKNMVHSLESSLKRLRTDYVDLYWLHIWERRTPIEEVMRALDDLVRQGKILYLAISDTPAWKVAEANTLARLRGWTPFVAYQAEYSLLARTPEREILPMAEDMGLTVMPWGPLQAGVLTGRYSRDDMGKGAGGAEGTREAMNRARGLVNEDSMRVVDVVKAIAGELDRSPGQVALRWILQRPGGMIPILGARTCVQLEENLGCLDFALPGEAMQRLDEVSDIDLGFPMSLLTHPRVSKNMLAQGLDIEGGY